MHRAPNHAIEAGPSSVADSDVSKIRGENPPAPICDAADGNEAAFLAGVSWQAGGSVHRSGSERQARLQEGYGAVEALLFFRHGHAESSCAPEYPIRVEK